jgi:hypothetical protein
MPGTKESPAGRQNLEPARDASAFAAAPRLGGSELEKTNVQGRLIAHLIRPIPGRPAD